MRCDGWKCDWRMMILECGIRYIRYVCQYDNVCDDDGDVDTEDLEKKREFVKT